MSDWVKWRKNEKSYMLRLRMTRIWSTPLYSSSARGAEMNSINTSGLIRVQNPLHSRWSDCFILPLFATGNKTGPLNERITKKALLFFLFFFLFIVAESEMSLSGNFTENLFRIKLPTRVDHAELSSHRYCRDLPKETNRRIVDPAEGGRQFKE